MARTLYPWEVPAPAPVVEAPVVVEAPAPKAEPVKPKATKAAKPAPVVENPADDDGELDSDMS
jgi:hypothetical protein